MRHRVAIVLSHPTQYYSPWFQYLARRDEFDLKLFYLWDFGVTDQVDRGFGHSLKWDLPLLDGYEYEFVPNVSKRPGTHGLAGLNNPTLCNRLKHWCPTIILVFGYAYLSHIRLLFSRRLRAVPKFLRGDSHILNGRRGWKRRVSKALRTCLFRQFYGALAVGGANKSYLQDSGFVDSRIFFAPHSVDNDRFRLSQSGKKDGGEEWRKELGIEKDAFVFLFVGKFEDKKRPLDLLAAFHRLQGKCPDLNTALLFVGSGELGNEMKALTTDCGSRVYIAPFQNQLSISRAYMSGDVLVLPSFGSGETWGLVVNEAMNFAKPAIVSSHVGCAQDLVVPNETGWVFPAGDIDGLLSAMTEAARNRERCSGYGANAYKRVGEYSYEATTRGLLVALESIQ